jgi:hypothetical protein
VSGTGARSGIGRVTTQKLAPRLPGGVGTGKRLFDEASTPASFKVESAQTTSAGAILLAMRPSAFATGGVAAVDGRWQSSVASR